MRLAFRYDKQVANPRLEGNKVSTVRNLVADASVLVNFLAIDRMDLIAAYPAKIFATDHVAGEISRPEQEARYSDALDAGTVAEIPVDDPVEVELFGRLSAEGRLGAGERSAIAVALNRSWGLAIDDNRAIRRAIREAGEDGRRLSIVRTTDIVAEAIRRGTLAVGEADAILADWAENHRFTPAFASFRDILS